MLKRLLILIVFISLQSFSQTFTTGVVELGNGSSNIFSSTSIGPDGRFYCFFNDGNVVNTINNVIPAYRLKRWEPSSSSWVSVANLDASVIPGAIVTSSFTMFSDGNALEIDSSGGYHMLITVYTSNGTEIKYVYSANGSSWTYTTIDHSNNQTNYSFANVQLKLDATNKPHVYYLIKNIGTGGISTRVYSVMHKYFNGSAWNTETAYSQTGGSGTGANDINMMSASIDGNNKSHIAMVAETNGSGTDGSLLYLNNTSGTWSAPVFLATGSTGTPAADRVYILSDTNNKQHIVYRQNSNTLKVMYTTNKTGSWNGGQINSNLTAGLMSSIDGYYTFARNTYNDLALVYNASPTTTNTGQINYAILFNGGSNWQIGTAFSGNLRTGQYISAEYTNANTLMMTFDHFAGTGNPSYGPPENPRQLHYATSTVTNLSTENILKEELKVYPNPTSSFVNIDAKNLTNVTIQILDIDGRVLSTQKLSKTNQQDVSSLSPGVYVLKIISDQGTKTVKLLKK